MATVMHRGGVGLERANNFVALVHIGRKLVAEVAFAVRFGPVSIQVLLPALSRFPVRGRGLLFDDFLFMTADLLLRYRDQRRIDDLATTRDITLAHQLVSHAIEQGLRARFTNPVLERPDRGSVRYVAGMRQPAKALVAHAIQQLVFHLFVRQVVEPFEHQNPNHRFRWKRRPCRPTSCPDAARHYPPQRRERKNRYAD